MNTNFIKTLFLLFVMSTNFTFNSCTPKEDDLKVTMNAGFVEKQVTLGNGSIINYAEGPNNGNKALLLIHGQTGAWQDYKKVLPELSQNWHVYAVDCHGHGKSTHDESKYYVDSIGNDLIIFVDEIIKKNTVVSGHSSGALIAAYVAGNENNYVVGSLLEDPPVFSTEKEYFPRTFVYYDVYLNIHNFLISDKSECWEVFYLKNCLWGKMYLPGKMGKVAEEAKRYHEKNPEKSIKIWFLPKSVNEMISNMFTYIPEYDFKFGDNYYNSTWQNGISHEKLISDIKGPCVFMHAKDAYAINPDTSDSILMAASSDAQARKAVSLIKECELVELVSGHDIHLEKPQEFITAINKLLYK
jgi:pimeloyl-ACP methyl ester carboxylesterase